MSFKKKYFVLLQLWLSDSLRMNRPKKENKLTFTVGNIIFNTIEKYFSLRLLVPAWEGGVRTNK